MARSYGLSGFALYRDVILPGALPSILVGVRFAFGLMWVMLIVAETISAQSGIGYMTMNAREFLQTDVVVVGILLYALLGKLADMLAKADRAGNAALASCVSEGSETVTSSYASYASGNVALAGDEPEVIARERAPAAAAPRVRVPRTWPSHCKASTNISASARCCRTSISLLSAAVLYR